MTEEPHPYELGWRDGRWRPHGCRHCDQRPGSEIHNPALWDREPRDPAKLPRDPANLDESARGARRRNPGPTTLTSADTPVSILEHLERHSKGYGQLHIKPCPHIAWTCGDALPFTAFGRQKTLTDDRPVQATVLILGTPVVKHGTDRNARA